VTVKEGHTAIVVLVIVYLQLTHAVSGQQIQDSTA